jgi:hypothetical protein
MDSSILRLRAKFNTDERKPETTTVRQAALNILCSREKSSELPSNLLTIVCLFAAVSVIINNEGAR